jgi:hypothetical protein
MPPFPFPFPLETPGGQIVMVLHSSGGELREDSLLTKQLDCF